MMHVEESAHLRRSAINTECNGCGAEIEPKVFWDAYCEKCRGELSATEPPQWVPEREPKPTRKPTGKVTLDEVFGWCFDDDWGLSGYCARRLGILLIMLIAFLPVAIAMGILELFDLW